MALEASANWFISIGCTLTPIVYTLISNRKIPWGKYMVTDSMTAKDRKLLFGHVTITPHWWRLCRSCSTRFEASFPAGGASWQGSLKFEDNCMVSGTFMYRNDQSSRCGKHEVYILEGGNLRVNIIGSDGSHGGQLYWVKI